MQHWRQWWHNCLVESYFVCVDLCGLLFNYLFSFSWEFLYLSQHIQIGPDVVNWSPAVVFDFAIPLINLCSSLIKNSLVLIVFSQEHNQSTELYFTAEYCWKSVVFPTRSNQTLEKTPVSSIPSISTQLINSFIPRLIFNTIQHLLSLIPSIAPIHSQAFLQTFGLMLLVKLTRVLMMK